MFCNARSSDLQDPLIVHYSDLSGKGVNIIDEVVSLCAICDRHKMCVYETRLIFPFFLTHFFFFFFTPFYFFLPPCFGPHAKKESPSQLVGVLGKTTSTMYENN